MESSLESPLGDFSIMLAYSLNEPYETSSQHIRNDDTCKVVTRPRGIRCAANVGYLAFRGLDRLQQVTRVESLRITSGPCTRSERNTVQ